MRTFLIVFLVSLILGCSRTDYATKNELREVEDSVVELALKNASAHKTSGRKISQIDGAVKDIDDSMSELALRNADAHKRATQKLDSIDNTLDKTGVSRMAQHFSKGDPEATVVSLAALADSNQYLRSKMQESETSLKGEMQSQATKANQIFLPRNEARGFVSSAELNRHTDEKLQDYVVRAEFDDVKKFAKSSQTRFRRYRVQDNPPDAQGWVVQRVVDTHYEGHINGGPASYRWKWSKDRPELYSLEALVTSGYHYTCDIYGRRIRRREVSWVTVKIENDVIYLPPSLEQFDYDIQIPAPYFPLRNL